MAKAKAEALELIKQLPDDVTTGFYSSGTSNYRANISFHQAGLTLISLWIRQHLQNAFREVFVDFDVSRNRLGDFRDRVVIPIALSTVANE
jgi:hypothetical protein